MSSHADRRRDSPSLPPPSFSLSLFQSHSFSPFICRVFVEFLDKISEGTMIIFPNSAPLDALEIGEHNLYYCEIQIVENVRNSTEAFVPSTRKMKIIVYYFNWLIR